MSSSTAPPDPLRLLRNTLANKHEVHLLSSSEDESSQVSSLSSCSYISFPSSSSSSSSSSRVILAKTTPTRFKRTPQSTSSETWDLQALLLCYLQREASIAEYAQEAVKEGVELVGIMQRKLVNEYLENSLSAQGREQVQGYIAPDGDGVNEDTSVENTLASTAAAASAATTGQEGATTASTDSTAAIVSNTVSTSGDGARPAKKARYVVNKEDLESYKRIVSFYESKQMSDRNSVLRGGNTGRVGNFSNVRELISERLKSGKEELRKGTHAGSGGHHGSVQQPAAAAHTSQRKRRQANPIIIISPSSSALITMYNVKRFLEDSVYEPSDVARLSSGRIAEDVVQINHKRQIGTIPGGGGGGGDGGGREEHGGGLSGVNRTERGLAGEKLTRYFVVDGVDALSKFGDDAWDRVVCVMTTGQEWQFRPYKWTEPKELFHHVKGIYPKFTNDPPNPKLANWNVTELKIDPAKRHIDKSTVSDFWRGLEGWIGGHKNGVVDW